MDMMTIGCIAYLFRQPIQSGRLQLNCTKRRVTNESSRVKTMWTIKKGVVVESLYGKFATKELAEKELAKRKVRNANRKERDDVMRSCGLVKVKGAVSGRTYWE